MNLLDFLLGKQRAPQAIESGIPITQVPSRLQELLNPQGMSPIQATQEIGRTRTVTPETMNAMLPMLGTSQPMNPKIQELQETRKMLNLRWQTATPEMRKHISRAILQNMELIREASGFGK